MIFLTWTPRIVAEGYVEDYLAPTPHLKEQIKTRCLDYLAKYLHLGFVDAPPQKGQEDSYCDQIWQVFAKAFAFKDACTVTEQDYMPLFDATGNSDIKDKPGISPDRFIRLSIEATHAPTTRTQSHSGFCLPAERLPMATDTDSYHRENKLCTIVVKMMQKVIVAVVFDRTKGLQQIKKLWFRMFCMVVENKDNKQRRPRWKT
ncbi:hypothetical protein QZH41_007272 [Actinostola sp. cb2023]|nr:hypothetical protein QZH41_007272 [Actinostola sp. cb2023]